MIHPQVARQLRSWGYDALGCHEAGMGNRAIPDDGQLAYAAQNDRAILTNDGTDYLALDGRWKERQQRHAGIIVVPKQIDVGRLIRCTARHLDTVPPDVQADTLLWLDTGEPP